jgi:hypothetical protein
MNMIYKMGIFIWTLITTQPVRLENVALVGDEGVVSEGFANALEMDAEGWVQLSSYAEVPHPKGIQRIDRAAAVRLENSFNGFMGKLGRLFRGVPVYRGHPDVPERKAEYPDDAAYGWVQALQARADGLYGRIDFNPAGKALVENKSYRFPSPYWEASPVGMENGKTIYQPHTLLSVGLTNRPRIPVQALANDDAGDKGTIMNKEIIAALLGMAATATEADITNKINELRGGPARITTLENSETTLKTTLTSEQAEHGKTREKLTTLEANAKKAIEQRNSLALENALEAGRITPAEKEEWNVKLTTDWETNSAALLKKAKGMKTRTALENSAGSRRGTSGENAQDIAAAKFRAEVVKLENSGLNHHEAWMNAQAAHPALYAAMENAGDEENS